MKTLILFALMGFSVSLLQAAPCIPDTFANYQALGVTGCNIGQFTFKNFDLSTVSSTVGYPATPASAVNVTPTQGATKLNLHFASSSWTVSGAQGVSYLLRYDVDPPPIIIRGFEDDLSDTSIFDFRASVFGSDRINVTTDLCVGNIYVGGVCNSPGTPLAPPLMVFDGGPSTQLVDVRTFPLVNMVGVRNTITLQALGTSATMTALDNGVLITPEPSAFLLIGSGLVALLVRRVRAKIH